MERQITVKLCPKSGQFYALRAKYMDRYVINTDGGPGEWTVRLNDDAARTIMVEATGTIGSEFGCIVTRSQSEKEVFKHEKTHAIVSKRDFSETLLC